jgi:hypothetical protein
MARKDAKTQRREACPPRRKVKPSKPQFLCASALCEKKKRIGRPAILRGWLQSRKAAKKGSLSAAAESQTEWNHVRLEMIKNQIKVLINPKAWLY